jgi:hypothetical protein
MRIQWIYLLICALSYTAAHAFADEPLSHNRDVRLIFGETCFQCHGIDSTKRKAGLALHDRALATRELEDGHAAIVPGKPEDSELIARISSNADRGFNK